MSDGPSTSWANWAWLACGDGRLVEVSEVRLQVFGLTARAEKAEAERDRLREALTPNEATKEAYMGEFYFSQTMIGDDGNDVTVKTSVPWTTVKEIMAAILARAALKGESHE